MFPEGLRGNTFSSKILRTQILQKNCYKLLDKINKLLTMEKKSQTGIVLLIGNIGYYKVVE